MGNISRYKYDFFSVYKATNTVTGLYYLGLHNNNGNFTIDDCFNFKNHPMYNEYKSYGASCFILSKISTFDNYKDAYNLLHRLLKPARLDDNSYNRTIFYVYETTNIITGEKYIGKHGYYKNLGKRDLGIYYKGSGTNLERAIKTYGRHAFTKVILQECDTEDEAYQKEQYYISQLNAQNDNSFYNIEKGGLGRSGYEVSDETRAKLSKANLNNGKWQGVNNYFYGKTGSLNLASKPVVVLDKDGNILAEFECVRELAESDYNIDYSYRTVLSICENQRLLGRYSILYKTDYEVKLADGTLLDFLSSANKQFNTRKKNEEINNSIIYEIDIETCDVLNVFNNIRDIIDLYGSEFNFSNIKEY